MTIPRDGPTRWSSADREARVASERTPFSEMISMSRTDVRRVAQRCPAVDVSLLNRDRTTVNALATGVGPLPSLFRGQR